MNNEKGTEIQEVQKIIENVAARETEAGRVQPGVFDFEIEHQLAILEGIKNDITARKKYAFRIFLLVIAWLGVILLIIIATGFGLLKISDTVLIALITSTTVNITAFFLVVTRYLFPSAKTI